MVYRNHVRKKKKDKKAESSTKCVHVATHKVYIQYIHTIDLGTYANSINDLGKQSNSMTHSPRKSSGHFLREEEATSQATEGLHGWNK